MDGFNVDLIAKYFKIASTRMQCHIKYYPMVLAYIATFTYLNYCRILYELVLELVTWFRFVRDIFLQLSAFCYFVTRMKLINIKTYILKVYYSEVDIV